ncbi:MAG: competence/damage-inducible protein A [Alphaproteobacteria bacterium]|nr:competence/damage-inducible protein A [Alphaproteobacteria bacterium]
MNARPVEAAVLIVGNEILSGRTQDLNLAWLATRLGEHGIRVTVARVVRDEQPAIVDAVRDLAASHDYVFTTGGIGPTHDDITPGSVAAAFGRPLVRHAAAVEKLATYYRGRGDALNAARLRMAEAAEGAELIWSPGAGIAFRVENVFVLAGIPRVMQAQFNTLAPTLRRGAVVLSRSVDCALAEGNFAEGLGLIQEAFPAVEIGSYPYDRNGEYAARIVLRSADNDALERALSRVTALMEYLGGSPKLE